MITAEGSATRSTKMAVVQNTRAICEVCNDAGAARL
jgi:hypothetical protein